MGNMSNNFWFKKNEGLKKEYCLIGLNRFNYEIGKKLINEGHKITVLDIDEKKIDIKGEEFTNAIVCDCTNVKELVNIGIQFFDYVILGISDIKTSVITAANLKELKIKNIICKAKDETHKKILRLLGIGVSYIPEEVISTKVAYKLMYDLDVDLFSWNDEVSETLVVKIPVLNKNLWNKSVKKCNTNNFAWTIISIKRSTDETITPVGGDVVIREGDMVCLICNKNQINEIKNFFENN